MIKAALAANSTAITSTGNSPEMRSAVDSETKNKRQVNQYLRTPGTSAITSIGTDSGPQVFPLQLSQGVYSQQRVPLYTRRPTTASKPQAIDDGEEEQEPQQQLQVRHLIARFQCSIHNIYIHVHNWHFYLRKIRIVLQVELDIREKFFFKKIV